MLTIMHADWERFERTQLISVKWSTSDIEQNWDILKTKKLSGSKIMSEGRLIFLHLIIKKLFFFIDLNY